MRTTLYLSGSSIQTPYLIDFERNTLLGGGGRVVASYRTTLAGRTLRLQGGGEGQTGFESSRNYQNRAGTPGQLRYDDEIRTLTGFAFAQADYELPAGLLLTAGASYNRLRYRISRISDAATRPRPTNWSATSGPRCRRGWRCCASLAWACRCTAASARASRRPRKRKFGLRTLPLTAPCRLNVAPTTR
ncbi:hypothetical protein MUN84_18350 [Hymenobacter sp. 5516J-16]|uniref:hypothetical protein n=1 Tax=Hymenobacter sp. 5516J-16 TaxID=2932253 RepID=UPI001FD334EB|nr:hypothetical protein [Hymenobacter sp. 5516J-16]UOQ76482.1 hypothetical protein MUN84_18350 [Hymenobacter sp. 5516J-16]